MRRILVIRKFSENVCVKIFTVYDNNVCFPTDKSIMEVVGFIVSKICIVYKSVFFKVVISHAGDCDIYKYGNFPERIVNSRQK